MLQFTDTNLDSALAAGQERFIRPVLLIDWLKVDSWGGLNPGTKITSDELINVTCQDDVSGGLPDEVTGRPTYSSTVLTATFSGTYYDLSVQGEEPLWRLFSPWNRNSPYHGLTLEGAAVRLVNQTETEAGRTETRRFTGWIDSYTVDRVQGTVTIVAKNNLHLLGRKVTLPRWARITNVKRSLPHISGWDIPDEDRMENAPLTAAYLFQNVLRQCQAMPGPDPHDGCIWSSSGYGGLIPEIGALGSADSCHSYMSQGISQYVYPGNWEYPNFNRTITAYGGPGMPGTPYHRTTQGSGSSSDLFDSYSQSGTTVEIHPNIDPRYMNGGLWVVFPSTDSGGFIRQDIFFSGPGITGTSTETESAMIRLHVGSGSTTLMIKDDDLVSTPVSRTLTVATPTAKDTFVYVSWEVDFQNPANSRIWYNNVLQTTSSSGSLSTYPRLDPGLDLYLPLARVWARGGGSGWQDAEVWRTGIISTGDRIRTWSNTSYGRKDFAIVNGGFDGAKMCESDFTTFSGSRELGGSMPRVTYIPARTDVDAWGLLVEMATAFQMAMWIDNYGGLRIIPQQVLEGLENRLLDPRQEIDGDQLQGISLTSASDNVRKTILYDEQRGQAAFGVVFDCTDPWQFRCNASSNINYTVPANDLFISSSRHWYLNVAPGTVGAGGGHSYAEDGGKERWGYSGFMATQEDGYAGNESPITTLSTFAAVVPIGLGQTAFGLRIENAHTQKVFLAMGNDGTEPPNQGALLVPGMYNRLDNVTRRSLGPGDKSLSLPRSQFHSSSWTLAPTVQSLLTRASRNIPRADDVTVPGDPRREVYDMLELKDPDGGIDVVLAQVIGRSDSWSPSEGYTQVLSIRLTVTPGSWLLGISEFSELGENTYLS